MRGLLTSIEEALKNSATYLPLEVSSFLGGLIEEIIAPIPSPFVMAAVGSAAFAQSKGFIFLLWLAFLGSAGKTIGAWVIYYIAGKLEDVVVGKFGRLLGVSHQEVEGLGKHFKGGWKDDLILFSLRALPIVPSSPVSVVCGVIKINLRTYLISTLAGNFFRNLAYIYLGYSGISAYKSILNGLDSVESILQVMIFMGFAALIGWIYYKRHQRTNVKAL
jgi:membrane protein DedA with SNARE-associated domain